VRGASAGLQGRAVAGIVLMSDDVQQWFGQCQYGQQVACPIGAPVIDGDQTAPMWELTKALTHEPDATLGCQLLVVHGNDDGEARTRRGRVSRLRHATAR